VAVDSIEAQFALGRKQQDRREDMRSFLKGLRRRLDPNTTILGEHKRLSSRRGRRVSQEEIAEAIGVSRCWYALLEAGAPINPSLPFLHRLADALNATTRERATLFALAIPELGTILIPAWSDAG
jgi:DNA-binding XRE family transcriptional regulator